MIYIVRDHLFAIFFSVLSVSICTVLYAETNPKWKNYHVIGTATSFGFNKGLIYDTRETKLEFTFEDADGNRACAPFRLHLSTVGACIDFSLNLYFAKLAGSNLTLFDVAENPIKIGRGIFAESIIYFLKTYLVDPFTNRSARPNQNQNQNQNTCCSGIDLPTLSDTFNIFGVGVHFAFLERRPGYLVLFGPNFGLSVGIGMILGGSLEMIAEPTFYDAQTQDRPLKSKPA